MGNIIQSDIKDKLDENKDRKTKNAVDHEFVDYMKQFNDKYDTKIMYKANNLVTLTEAESQDCESENLD